MAETREVEDVEISRFVKLKLGWLPRVDSTHIGVSVTDGVVTLTGHVSTYMEKVRAGEAVQRVRGVVGLAQEIEVHTRHTALTDGDIARGCGVSLRGAIDVPASVKVAVANRRVSLSGEVQWQFQREAAVRSVAYLKGVTGIENDITLQSNVVAMNLQAAIEAALVNHAALESRKILVSTLPGGGIILTGKVASWAERRRAERACWAAPGVTAVHNRLTQ